eukprot:CAMPEP_0202918656 /NCGR_PEP_ID=MMETSP1392-20130828/73990_1 /ASSEMBLY_ACC=CAM_ASM_000868 /TAXON_ID=225041 /ORGANISM="Chlamydomonas chlamydogama, Strain SAG 11-48b" /LENGTH=166 /DNA_ID=CAMNT_0049611783 /DNA_START=67 /DNA_END=563 /DNA_ORIENTATION=+
MEMDRAYLHRLEWLLALLLLLAIQAVHAQTTRSGCKPLNISSVKEPAQSTWLSLGTADCYFLPGSTFPTPQYLVGSLSIAPEGTSDTSLQPEVDLAFHLFSTTIAIGSQLSLTNITLQNGMLFPAETGKLFRPAAFRMEGNTSRLQLRDCIVTTSCDNLNSYLALA